MLKKNIYFIFILIIGCTAAGVPQTSDPSKKISYAYQLCDVGRSIPAKQLIDEALLIYTEQNDENGIAESYYTLGNFYKQFIHGKPERMRSFSESFYDLDGSKSISNFNKALALYKKNEDYLGVSKTLFVEFRGHLT